MLKNPNVCDSKWHIRKGKLKTQLQLSNPWKGSARLMSCQLLGLHERNFMADAGQLEGFDAFQFFILIVPDF